MHAFTSLMGSVFVDNSSAPKVQYLATLHHFNCSQLKCGIKWIALSSHVATCTGTSIMETCQSVNPTQRNWESDPINRASVLLLKAQSTR